MIAIINSGDFSPNRRTYPTQSKGSASGKLRRVTAGPYEQPQESVGRVGVLAFAGAAVAVIAVCIPCTAYAQAQPRQLQHPPLSARAGIKPTNREKSGPVIVVKDGRLSVTAEGVPLATVLDEISRRARVAINWDESIGTEPVSLHLQDQPLDEGLRTILKGHDAYFLYALEMDAPASLRAIWVYPKGRGAAYQPAPAEKWATTKEIERFLSDPDPAKRAKAVQTLVEREGQEAEPVVLRALTDDDPQVRTAALYAALGSAINLPAAPLEQALASDPSPAVKVLALDLLADSPSIEDLAERALADSDEHVRNKAREILNQLHPAPPSKERSGQSQGQQERPRQ